jgi:hypothetical protein
MYNFCMSLQWIEHKGQKILLIDVSGLADSYAMLLTKELASLIALLKAEPKNSVLAVADLRGTNLNNNGVMALIRNAPLAAPYFCRSALVIEFSRAVIIDTLGQFVERLPKRFDNLEFAKDWLVGHEIKQPA